MQRPSFQHNINCSYTWCISCRWTEQSAQHSPTSLPPFSVRNDPPERMRVAFINMWAADSEDESASSSTQLQADSGNKLCTHLGYGKATSRERERILQKKLIAMLWSTRTSSNMISIIIVIVITTIIGLLGVYLHWCQFFTPPSRDVCLMFEDLIHTHNSADIILEMV